MSAILNSLNTHNFLKKISSDFDETGIKIHALPSSFL